VSRLPEYLAYHAESARIGDIDPSYAMLRYVCDRFELNEEQRYWLAFIYGLTYCGASVFYVYNEFPDAENVDVGRLQRWWDARGRAEIICQTDRRYVRSNNQFVPAFESYRRWLGGKTQTEHFAALATGATPEERYDAVYRSARQLYSFGQFSLFLYLEALHTITPLDLAPTTLDLNFAHSCRNGLCYAYDLDQWLTESEMPTPAGAHDDIQAAWDDLLPRLRENVSPPPTVWNIETTLCAYKKFKRGAKRYVGYYLDRQAVEIAKMAVRVRDGVAWVVLWQFREETYERRHRAETYDGGLESGVSKRWLVRRHGETRQSIGAAESLALS
jgi:hypothetical protein